MKNKIYIFVAIATMVFAAIGTTSCKKDDFTDTIYDTHEYPLDRSQYTFPLDTFVKANFLEPYNLKFIYRMEDIGSDLQKNLTPADYNKSLQLAVLCKYLWFDVYRKHAGELFLQRYSPRIIHVIGSKNLNPSQGTETLGVAEGGIKITLYNVNNLNPNDIDMMNKYFFHTMHHEFGHILDQTHLHPTAFNLLSNGQYDAMGWSDTPDSVSMGRGFVSSYASSGTGEDWVETLALYVCADSIQWKNILNTAKYNWETVDFDLDKLVDDKKHGSFGSNDADSVKFRKYYKGYCDIDTVGYFKTSENGDNKIYRKVCKRDADDHVMLGMNVTPHDTTIVKDEGVSVDTVINDTTYFVQWENPSGIDGSKVIEQKLQMVREYMKKNYDCDIDSMRKEIVSRTFVVNEDGTMPTRKVYDEISWKYVDRPINRLVQLVGTTGKTLMEILEEQVTRFKELQK